MPRTPHRTPEAESTFTKNERPASFNQRFGDWEDLTTSDGRSMSAPATMTKNRMLDRQVQNYEDEETGDPRTPRGSYIGNDMYSNYRRIKLGQDI